VRHFPWLYSMSIILSASLTSLAFPIFAHVDLIEQVRKELALGTKEANEETALTRAQCLGHPAADSPSLYLLCLC
jgi:hypothetical protein